MSALRQRLNHAVCGDAQFWQWKRLSRYATFVTLRDAQPTDVGPKMPPSSGIAWFVVDDEGDPILDLSITDGAIHVDGLVEGSIKAGEVVVEKSGIVQGDIQTQNLIVAGQVSGNIAARGRAEFKASCHVEGDILSPLIKIEEGGRIDGRLQMRAGPSKPNATRSEPPG